MTGMHKHRVSILPAFTLAFWYIVVVTVGVEGDGQDNQTEFRLK